MSLHVKPQEFGLACRLVKVCRCRVCRGCLSGSSVFLFCLRLSLSLSCLACPRRRLCSPRGPFDVIGTIQRRLAWPRQKDDKHKSGSVQTTCPGFPPPGSLGFLLRGSAVRFSWAFVSVTSSLLVGRAFWKKLQDRILFLSLCVRVVFFWCRFAYVFASLCGIVLPKIARNILLLSGALFGRHFWERIF